VITHDFGKPRTRVDSPACMTSRRTLPAAPQVPLDADDEPVNNARGGTSRPDLVMVSGHMRTPLARRRVDILELKYCRDTEPMPQTDRAARQHVDFVEHLVEMGYCREKIHYHTIMLGVSGTIYKAMQPVLRALGVDKPAGQRLASKLHSLAAQYVEIIMQTKWNQERLRSSQQVKQGVG
jgi:hypothetical protein